MVWNDVVWWCFAGLTSCHRGVTHHCLVFTNFLFLWLMVDVPLNSGVDIKIQQLHSYVYSILMTIVAIMVSSLGDLPYVSK